MNETDNLNHANEHKARHFEIARVLNIPNVLSFSRLLLLPVILLLLQARQTIPALALMIVSWITDALDGYLARRLHQVTTVGKILDHVVDKIWVGTILVMLVTTRGLPWFVAAAVIGRDLVIVVGSVLILDRRRYVVSSHWIGKVAGTMFALLMILYMIDSGYSWLILPKKAALIAVIGLVIISLAGYGLRYIHFMRHGVPVEPVPHEPEPVPHQQPDPEA